MNEVRTTFVPRRPNLVTPQVVSPRGPNFVGLAATFIFIASAISAVGVYAWRWNLNRQIEGQAVQLEKARDSFDPDFIEQASLLNDRIVAANKILDEHLAPTELLEIFKQFTLPTVAFESFSATHQPDNSVAMTASGVGRGFESVVLQSDWFGEGPAGDGARLKDVVFSRLGENDRREATFSFSATIPGERILFARSLSQLPTSQVTSRAAAPSLDGLDSLAPSLGSLPSITGSVAAPAANSAPAATPATTSGARTVPPGSVTI